MKPHQCGTGLSMDHPVIVGFRHELMIMHLMRNKRSRVHRQLTPGPAFHAGDFVKVVAGELTDRWGTVESVHDGRDYDLGGYFSEWIYLVSLFAVSDGVAAPYPPGALPFAPEELGLLFAGNGDVVEGSRVIRERDWPRHLTVVTA